MMTKLRFLVAGVLVGTLALAVPLAQSEYIRQIAGGVLFGTGDARDVLFGNDGKGYIKAAVGGAVTFPNSATVTLPTSSALTTPVIDGVAYSALNDRQVIVEAVSISGAALHAANLTLWTAPANAVVLRVVLDVTTVATGAATVDIGYTATTATTSSDTFLDGVDVNAAIALFDSMNAALDAGANAKAQKAASAKWITADEASGDTTGMVAVAYIFYVVS